MNEIKFDKDAICDHCHQTGAYNLDDEFLCMDCCEIVEMIEKEEDELMECAAISTNNNVQCR